MNVIDTLTEQGYDVEHEAVEYLPTQEKVLQYLLYDPEVLAVLYYGGVGGGKSFTACKATIQILEQFPGAHCLLARDTRVNLESTTLQTLWGTDQKGHPILPYGIYDERDHNQTKGFINWPNGGYLQMMGLDTKSNISRVKSMQLSLAVLEEVNGIAWKIVKFIIETRMRHEVGPRKVLLTTNTDQGEDDVYKFFFTEHTCDPEKYCKNCPGNRCQMRRVLASTLDNKENLPDSYTKRTQHLAESDPRYHKIYMEGKFENVSGAIFPQFDERIHIIDFPAGYEWPDNGEWITRYGYDHGWGASPSCLLEAKIHVPTGQIVYWDEYYTNPEDQMTPKKMSADFHDMRVNYVHHADPSIVAKNQAEEDEITSVQLQFARYGITMEPANNDVSGGIVLMQTLLQPDPDHKCPIIGVAAEGLPNFPYMVMARVGGGLRTPNLRRQIKNYKNKQNVRGEENPDKFDPVKIDDHALDPARYIANGAPLPVKFRKEPPKPGTSGWAHKMQLKKKGLEDPNALRGGDDGFSRVSSL